MTRKDWPIAKYVRIESILIEARGELARQRLRVLAAQVVSEVSAKIKKRREMRERGERA